MFPLDIAVFAMLVPAWVLLALGRARPALFASFAAVVAGLVAFGLCHWQVLGAVFVGLIAFGAALIDMRLGARRRKLWRILGLASLALAMPAAALPYYFFPMFSLPRPDGPMSIGTTRLELVDPARRGVLEDRARDPRRIMVRLWYPANPRDRRPFAAYMPRSDIGVEARSLAENMGLRPFQLMHLAAIDTHSRADARPATTGRFPVLVFNHGYLMYPAQNTPLFERLASHGYVVVSIGHVYDSAASRFSDGWSRHTRPLVVTPAFGKALESLTRNMDAAHWAKEIPAYSIVLSRDRLSRSATAWIGDTRFVVATLEQGKLPALPAEVARHIDFSRIAYGGMSFGGGVAMQACEDDERCRAAISLDGVTYDPRTFDRDFRAPAMLLYSDWVQYPLFEGQPKGIGIQPMDFAYRRWVREARPGEVRLRVRGSGHMAFTDLGHMTRRFELSRYHGTIGPVEMDGILGDFSLAFLDRYVRGRPTEFPGRQLAAHPLVERHDPGAASRNISQIAHRGRANARHSDSPAAD